VKLILVFQGKDVIEALDWTDGHNGHPFDTSLQELTDPKHRFGMTQLVWQVQTMGEWLRKRLLDEAKRRGRLEPTGWLDLGPKDFKRS
jgi:hypothetical protein